MIAILFDGADLCGYLSGRYILAVILGTNMGQLLYWEYLNALLEYISIFLVTSTSYFSVYIPGPDPRLSYATASKVTKKEHRRTARKGVKELL